MSTTTTSALRPRRPDRRIAARGQLPRHRRRGGRHHEDAANADPRRGRRDRDPRRRAPPVLTTTLERSNVMHYLLSVEQEIRSVRLIFSAKQAGMEADTIRDRLAVSYVS